MSYLTWLCFMSLLVASFGDRCEDTGNIVNGAGIAGYGVCAAVGGAFCAVTFGLGCAAAAACGTSAALHAGLVVNTENICRAANGKRSAERNLLGDDNTDKIAQYLEEMVVQTSDKNAIQEAALWTFIENMEDTAIDVLDNNVQTAVVKEAIKNIKKVEKVYKSLKKTKLVHLFKDNKEKIKRFGDIALKTKKQNNDLVAYLSGNNTIYKQRSMCTQEVVDGVEALILKLGGFYFMGGAIIENRVPSVNEIEDLKEKLVAHETSYVKHCN